MPFCVYLYYHIPVEIDRHHSDTVWAQSRVLQNSLPQLPYRHNPGQTQSEHHHNNDVKPSRQPTISIASQPAAFSPEPQNHQNEDSNILISFLPYQIILDY